MMITYNLKPLFKKDLDSFSKSYLKLKLWVVKLLKLNIEKSWFDYQTQNAVIWQYIMCCPKFCPAQIFISVLWKTQYIRLPYGLCPRPIPAFDRLSWAVPSLGKILSLSHCPYVQGQWRNSCSFVPKSCTVLSVNIQYWILFSFLNYEIMHVWCGQRTW